MVPNKHRYAAVVFRPDPDLYRRAREAVAAVGSDINSHVVAFLHWLVGDTGDLPPQPIGACRQARLPGQADSSAQ